MSEQRGWRYETPTTYKPPLVVGGRIIPDRECKFCKKQYRPVSKNQIHCQGWACEKEHSRELHARRTAKMRAKREKERV